MLKITDLNVWFHKAQVLSGITIEVRQGTFVAIVGSNGAGKTTLLRSIMNLHSNKKGAIKMFDRPIDGIPTHRIVREGISYVPDYRGILKSLSVLENLKIARRYYSNQAEFDRALESIFELFPNLKYTYARIAGLLSGGEQQMLAIARALLYRPKLLLIDEPSIGLAPILVTDIFNKLRGLIQGGMSILMVEQNIVRSLEVSDYCYVMEKGRILLEGKSDALARRDDLINCYFGLQG